MEANTLKPSKARWLNRPCSASDWPRCPALGGFATVGPSERADSPFVTDDPEFSPGWEIKFGMTAERNTGGNTWTAPVLDLNYAVVPSVRLNLTTYTKHIWPDGGSHHFGYGDTEFKVKWRFLDEDAKGARPALGIAPKVFIPTADDSRGLGDGVWRFQVPLQFGKTTGRWYHFAGAGYQWAFDRAASDSFYGGAGTLYSFTDHFALGAEFYNFVPTRGRSSWQPLTTLGAVYTFNEHWALKASVSHTLRGTARGRPESIRSFLRGMEFLREQVMRTPCLSRLASPFLCALCTAICANPPAPRGFCSGGHPGCRRGRASRRPDRHRAAASTFDWARRVRRARRLGSTAGGTPAATLVAALPRCVSAFLT